VTGQAIAAFVIPLSGVSTDDLARELREHVAREIGPVAKPRDIVIVPDLPKTRSGKIMRRLLGDLVDSRPLGDTTSLQDATVPHRIAEILRA
jgi:acetyl-CoA synthetase